MQRSEEEEEEEKEERGGGRGALRIQNEDPIRRRVGKQWFWLLEGLQESVLGVPWGLLRGLLGAS